MSFPDVVFIGPTLGKLEAEKHLSAVYLPPIEQGDLMRAVRTFSPARIAIIDGAFGRVPAVRHKEILWALQQGISVYGAASMGALRAAELWPFGMIGVGLIFRWYRRNDLLDDDEVAVEMMPPELDSGPTSEALVNMRLTWRLAERAGIISTVQRAKLEEIAVGTPFYIRTLSQIYESVGEHIEQARLSRLRAWTTINYRDQKGMDAVALLRRLAANPTFRSSRRGSASFCLPITHAWAHELRECGLNSTESLNR